MSISSLRSNGPNANGNLGLPMSATWKLVLSWERQVLLPSQYARSAWLRIALTVSMRFPQISISGLLIPRKNDGSSVNHEASLFAEFLAHEVLARVDNSWTVSAKNGSYLMSRAVTPIYTRQQILLYFQSVGSAREKIVPCFQWLGSDSDSASLGSNPSPLAIGPRGFLRVSRSSALYVSRPHPERFPSTQKSRCWRHAEDWRFSHQEQRGNGGYRAFALSTNNRSCPR